MAEPPTFSEYCIYTIVHAGTLDEKAKKGGSTKFPEKRAWTTGEDLLRKAKAAGQEMFILFGDAAYGGELIYWGILVDIKLKDATTEYTVKALKRLPKGHTPQELELRSTGKRIAPNFIRPYAICHTPKFLPA